MFKSIFFPILSGITSILTGWQEKEDLPNILWIVCEDTSSSLLGCYGNTFATTPNIDNLAKEGVLFENVFSAPASSPSRSTLITGMLASSLGTDNLRSKYTIPDFIKFFPIFLRDAGYYTSNNAKEDYNTIDQPDAWNESSLKATYKNRKADQPFFAVFNLGITHESKIHNVGNKVIKLKHNPEDVPLPPYHPSTLEIKHDWTLFYDNIEKMDNQVGELLKELDEAGLSENTIVFFYSDNGGVIAGSKRFINEPGLHVPLIIRFPDKFKSLAPSEAGSRNKRVISFEDFAPTVLSLAEVKIPDYMEGCAFLGKQIEKEKEYAYAFKGRIDMRIDIVRSIRDKRYRYVRNYMPHKIYGQYSEYMWQAPSVVSWEKAFKNNSLNAEQSAFWKQKPTEELYDVSVDPFNVKNLAADKRYGDILKKMRNANREIIFNTKDAGFIPESMKVCISDTSTIYEFTHSTQYPLQKILETAEMSSSRNTDFEKELISRLTDKNPIVRYWAAMGYCILNPQSQIAKPYLTLLLKDKEPAVRIVAAEALYRLGDISSILPVLTDALQMDNLLTRLEAITVLEEMGRDALPALSDIKQMIDVREDKKIKTSPLWKAGHDIIIAKRLLHKLTE